jgi:hypothetical protein
VGAIAHAANPNDTHIPMLPGINLGAATLRHHAVTNFGNTETLPKINRVGIFTVLAYRNQY